MLLILIGGFLFWASNPAQPTSVALEALVSDEDIRIEYDAQWIHFDPVDANEDLALIFYPGGRVDYRAYAPVLRAIAEAGYPVYLVKMPLSLAVLDPDRAELVMEANPQVETWMIGGHSLGGAMAANYVYTHPDEVAGLLLWASYPAESNDISDRDIAVVSVYGELDGLATTQNVADSKPRLPQDTLYVEIKGGNHAQFGNYGEQKGDLKAEISWVEQQMHILEASLLLLAP